MPGINDLPPKLELLIISYLDVWSARNFYLINRRFRESSETNPFIVSYLVEKFLSSVIKNPSDTKEKQSLTWSGTRVKTFIHNGSYQQNKFFLPMLFIQIQLPPATVVTALTVVNLQHLRYLHLPYFAIESPATKEQTELLESIRALLRETNLNGLSLTGNGLFLISCLPAFFDDKSTRPRQAPRVLQVVYNDDLDASQIEDQSVKPLIEVAEELAQRNAEDSKANAEDSKASVTSGLTSLTIKSLRADRRIPTNLVEILLVLASKKSLRYLDLSFLTVSTNFITSPLNGRFPSLRFVFLNKLYPDGKPKDLHAAWQKDLLNNTNAEGSLRCISLSVTENGQSLDAAFTSLYTGAGCTIRKSDNPVSLIFSENCKFHVEEKLWEQDEQETRRALGVSR